MNLDQLTQTGSSGPRAESRSTAGGESDTLLRITNLAKTFPGVKALSGVDLTVSSGEIVALLGHNGSGKSTLVKVLAGLYKPDDGSKVDSTAEIHFIHQDLGLVPSLSTVENLGLSGKTTWRDLLPTHASEIPKAREGVQRFGGEFDVRAPISKISPAERTIVAIARATASWTSPRNVLVLDEPTATLHGGEADRLRAVVRQLANEGAGILYISHHLSEVVDLADRAVVLRDGKVAFSQPRGSFSEDSLLKAISGDRSASTVTTRERREVGSVRMNVKGLTSPRIHGLDIEVREHEILGIYGLIGSGREEVLGSIFGSQRASLDTFKLDGRNVQSNSTRSAIAAGLGYVPADRRGQAAVTSLTARENLTLASLPRWSLRRPFLSGRLERRAALRELGEVEVRPLDPERQFALFSGGNQQKIVIAKWLRMNPKVMLLDEPTQGVDVGARAAIHSLIRERARIGASFLVASSDEKEIADLCDRAIVMRDGVVAATFSGADLTEDNLLRVSLTSAVR